MAKIRYSDIAVYDKVIAERIICDFFDAKQSPELADKQVKIFFQELERHEKLLSDNPELYQVRFFSPSTGRPIRSFSCHWFVVFYIYEKETDAVVIWFIRPSKSDYSDIVYLI